MMDSLLKAPSTVMELAYQGITELEIRQEPNRDCILLEFFYSFFQRSLNFGPRNSFKALALPYLS